ncbi:MAG: hypothetical protein K5900_14420 [Butyrivibrio sp.]|nr:hypothetical protein [Butyrivibrio sp.]
MVITSIEVVTILLRGGKYISDDRLHVTLILGLLVDYYISQEISINPAQSAPRSGCGVDRHFLTDGL